MLLSLQRVAFESFRDLVKLARKGLTDEAGLAYVANESLDLRVAARFRASASAGVTLSAAPSLPGMDHRHAAAAVTPSADAPNLNSDATDEAVDDDEGGDDAAEDDMIDAVATGADALDAFAEETGGIRNFSAQLQRAVVQEEEEADHSGPPGSAAAVRKK